jgi:hypothetical protein
MNYSAFYTFDSLIHFFFSFYVQSDHYNIYRQVSKYFEHLREMLVHRKYKKLNE